jgi:L-arabinose isomerase
VLSQSVTTEEIVNLAAMVGTELLIIDAETTPRSFGNEIRWNQAAYRLGIVR